MFRPKYPPLPTLPTTQIPSRLTNSRDTPAGCFCQYPAAPRLSARRIAPSLGAGAGAVAAVVTVGIVLTALLAAVAVAAMSVTLATVVIRTLLTGQHRCRR
ncbi:SpdD protein [Streptomyces sp. 796.1]|uniref:SpdD protein n=1 Tax=Streptomyces sp. 796.1 TaxID=3163029 RepID=UPI0039C9D98E